MFGHWKRKYEALLHEFREVEFRHKMLEEERKCLKADIRWWEDQYLRAKERLEKEDVLESNHWKKILSSVRRCMWYDETRKEWVVPEARVSLLTNDHKTRDQVFAYLTGEPLRDQWGKVHDEGEKK